METLINIDKEIFLFLNSLNSPFLDSIMWFVSGTKQWIPLYLLLIFFMFYKKENLKAILSLLCVIVVIVLCDRISSGIFKPIFHRLRPSHEPSLEGFVHFVNNYKGGMYGFISSHAANVFGIAVFISLYFKKRWVSISIIFWAILVSYSRIYLGVHYLGDILCGAIVGISVAFGIYKLYKWAETRFIKDLQTKYKYNFYYKLIKRDKKQ